jgi:hypothetical protein
MEYGVATAVVSAVMPRLSDFIPALYPRVTWFNLLPSERLSSDTMHGIPQSLQEIAWITPRIKPRPSLVCPSEGIVSNPACLVQWPGYGPKRRGIVVRFLASLTDLSLVQSVQSGSEFHPSSPFMPKLYSFREYNATESWCYLQPKQSLRMNRLAPEFSFKF